MRKEEPTYNTIQLNQLNTPFTVIIGPNGTGKSMSLDSIKKELEQQDVQIAHFGAVNDNAIKKVNFYSDSPEKIMGAMGSKFSSEGEELSYSFKQWFQDYAMYALLKGKETEKDIWFLLDELDSGLSYDRIRLIVEQLEFIQTMELNEGRHLHVVLTSNSYELVSAVQKNVSNYEILNVETNENITDKIHSFEDFIQLYQKQYQKLNR